jgi:RWD domain/DRG Family Regulatory Proteins, Tma46
MGSKYPDEAPFIEIEDPVNFADGFEKELLDYIGQIVEENMGMEMGFTLVSSCTEWLNLKWDKVKADMQEEKEQAKRLQDEAERKKFEGTRVSVETFMAWKKEFDLDMGITEKREKALIDSKKLTGKELFLRDTTLNESDLKFLLEAGDSIENVKIDESLFADIGDLDIDDSDDEDYVPGQEV